MQTTHYPNPKILAFVEGMMERKFFNDNFKYVEVVGISNGSSWTVENMCNQISSKYYVKNMECDLIIVWIDKEGQKCSNSDFEEKIISSLVSKGAIRENIKICIPNRMTENLILADEQMIRKEFEKPNYCYNDEGANGKKLLSQLYNEKGFFYKETFHGVKLLKKMRLRNSALKSASAKDFINSLNLTCWWL